VSKDVSEVISFMPAVDQYEFTNSHLEIVI